MSTSDRILNKLGTGVVGYAESNQPTTEPTAMATLLLLAHGRLEEADRGLSWLLERQDASGSLGIAEGAEEPCWPTGLGLLCFVRAAQLGVDSSRFKEPIRAAVDWLLNNQGEAVEEPKGHGVFGHDTTMVAWPWVIGTHSWMEPSCLHIIALRAADQDRHPKTMAAQDLVMDRILPEGGCNYGNTYVLGQKLRPHLQPSGMAAVALSASSKFGEFMGATLDYLEKESLRTRAAASLSWSSLGLVANGREHRPDRLLAAVERAFQGNASPYRIALLGLALLGENSPLLPTWEVARQNR